MDNSTYAFLLTFLAGLSTGIGSLIAFLTRNTNRPFLAVSLGFSAGVMIYVSMIDIFQKSKEMLQAEMGVQAGLLITVAAFFGGIFLIAIIDKLIPSYENPHEVHMVEKLDDVRERNHFKKLHRMGILAAAAIALHNLPEGLVTFVAALKDPVLGVSIAIAIAIHNIPEGISISVPIYYSTGSRKKAFLYSFLSGLAEPFGAVVGYFLLRSIMNDITFGIAFAAVAGIMVFISLDELLPAAQEYGEHHYSIYGLILGMLVMAGSILLLT